MKFLIAIVTVTVIATVTIAQDNECVGQYLKKDIWYSGIYIKFSEHEKPTLFWHTTGTRFYLDGCEVRRKDLPDKIRAKVKWMWGQQLIEIRAYTR